CTTGWLNAMDYW
nr:immunoglobulin heavy chain junction region [Mus musculus]NSM04100.1 immunoglobulin heavy chain junction region [Mus musculus]NSM04557.1 immunoglobulin heavy chain junction region [Mus musculus]NSM04584.1 immunoglobulin heavy chain junction region [Mus musculus]NSM04661.1 immunoglobulin heavy chain junction region [Mus musculus]